MKTIIDDVKKSSKAQSDNDEAGLQKILDAAGINYLDSDNEDVILHTYPLWSGSMILDENRWIIDEVYDFLKENNKKLFKNWKFIWEESTNETNRDEFWAERTKLIKSL